jgi:hypothetical protein
MWSTLRNEGTKNTFGGNLKSGTTSNLNSNLISKYSYWRKYRTHDLAGPWDWSAVREICQNWRFSCTRRGISRARERHAAESRVACCICVLLRSPKNQFWRFSGETIERAAFVSTLRNGLSLSCSIRDKTISFRNVKGPSYEKNNWTIRTWRWLY